MKKKIIIYLLAAVMILSPAAVFADTAADAAAGDAVSELEQVSSDAVNFNGNDECFWVEGSGRSKAADKDGNIATGLFKAQRQAGKLGLYYADANGLVVLKEGPVTVTSGDLYVYTKVDGETGWSVTGGSSYTYLIKNHNGDYYAVNELESLETIGSTKYYVKNGIVQTTPGLITFGGKYYYIQPNAQGAIRSTAGIFKAANGKTYMSDATGAIIMTPGAKAYGAYYYVIQSDGSLCTTKGFVRAGGNLYYVFDSTGALYANKEFKEDGKKYHALNDATIAIGGHKWGKKYYYSDDSGAIRTKKGIVKAGGKYYYVQKGGTIATNKKVKYKGKSYIAGKNGVIYTGLFKWKKNLYYASDKGVLKKKAGVVNYNGATYYVKKGGKVRTNGLFTASGKKYCAAKDGKLFNGYFSWKSNYYLTNAKCVIITKQGLYTYNKHIYYVGKGGALATNRFVEQNDKYYYAGSKGAILRSKFNYKRNGTTYTLHPNSKTGVISNDEYYKVFPEEAPQEDKDQ